MMADLVGRTLGHYEIIEEIGRGGMAVVYRAYQPSMDRPVAIKVLPRQFTHDPTFASRFEREAKTIAALEHSAIVPVHDYGEYEGQPYLVMRYMPGGSLADHIQQGSLSLEEVTSTFARVASALDAAHNKGIIHRDVKPNNILFDAYNEAFLSDFGIVRLAEATAQLTGTGFVGTPAYMAPEMARPGGVTPLIDVYALGVTLFQALTGRLPYEADTPMGLMMAHVTEPIPDTRELQPDLPDAVQAVIERALTKRPGDRYQTAGELAADLRAAATVAPTVQPAVLAPTLIEPMAGGPELPEVPALPAKPVWGGVNPPWIGVGGVVLVGAVVGVLAITGVFGGGSNNAVLQTNIPPVKEDYATEIPGAEIPVVHIDTPTDEPTSIVTDTSTPTRLPTATNTLTPTDTSMPTRRPTAFTPAAAFPPVLTDTPKCISCPPGMTPGCGCNCCMAQLPSTGPGCKDHGGPGNWWACADGTYLEEVCGGDCGAICRATLSLPDAGVVSSYCFPDGHCQCTYVP
jgi:tRNA A-37 threonylcarbamoyl transferase component Bud32